MKTLTVIVLCTGDCSFLRRCLDSLLYSSPDNLEVLVMSSDAMAGTVAQKYYQQFPNIVNLIREATVCKKGEALEIGAKRAAGKYLMVLNSGDWINIVDFQQLVNELRHLNDDLVLTNYQNEKLYDSSPEVVSIATQRLKRQNMNNLRAVFDKVAISPYAFALKASLCRTFLENETLLGDEYFAKLQLLFMAIIHAESFGCLDLNVTRHFISSLSLNHNNFINRHSYKKFIEWSLNIMDTVGDNLISSMLMCDIVAVTTEYYNLYYQKIDASNSEICELFRFDEFLAATSPNVHNMVDGARAVRRRLSPERRLAKRCIHCIRGQK